MTKKQVIIGIIILLVVGVAGFVGYKIYLKNKNKDEDNSEELNTSIPPAVENTIVDIPKPQIQPQMVSKPAILDASKVNLIKGVSGIKKAPFELKNIQLLHNVVSQ